MSSLSSFLSSYISSLIQFMPSLSSILKRMRELDKLMTHLTLITLRAEHFYYAYTQLSRFQKYENDKEDRYHNLFYDVIRTIWI